MHDHRMTLAERAFVVGHSIAWTIVLYAVFQMRHPALLALVPVLFLVLGYAVVRLRARDPEHWDHRVRPWLITAGLALVVLVAFLPRFFPS